MVSLADPPLSSLLRAQPVVLLDGGLGTELAFRGHDLSDPLWSARLLSDSPEAIGQVHRDFLEAGADVVTTASYQVSYEGFAARGLGEAAVDALLVRSVALACEARDAFWANHLGRVAAIGTGTGTESESVLRARHRPLVAASVGPFGATRADGSEYRGHYGLDPAALADWHRRRLAVLAAAGADLLACETLPCLEEAEAVVGLLPEHPGLFAWVSFTCRDGARLAQGEPFAEAAARIAARPQVLAVGVNCTAPRHVGALLAAAAARTSAPLLAYPNRGEVWDAAARCWRPGPGSSEADPEPELVAAAPAWQAAGARLLGGCCGVRPEDIGRLRTALLGPGAGLASATSAPGGPPPRGRP